MDYLLGTSLINTSGAPTVENPTIKNQTKKIAPYQKDTVLKKFPIYAIDKLNQLSYKIFHSINTSKSSTNNLNATNQITNLPSSQAPSQKFPQQFFVHITQKKSSAQIKQ